MARRKRRHGKPDQFQWLAVNASPASETDAQKALHGFIKRFVVKAKLERAELFLLDPVKRDRGMQEVWGWLDRSKTSDLGGSAGFPQHLAARFGDLRGTYIDGTKCALVTIAEAAVLAATAGDRSLFVSTDQGTAILFEDVGCPTLCIDPSSKMRTTGKSG